MKDSDVIKKDDLVTKDVAAKVKKKMDRDQKTKSIKSTPVEPKSAMETVQEEIQKALDKKTVKETKPKKEKVPKYPYPDATCEKCGATFSPAKFHPKQRFCSACSKIHKESLPNELENICMKCSKPFTVSKFNASYTFHCPDCRTIIKAERIANKQIKNLTPDEVIDIKLNGSAEEITGHKTYEHGKQLVKSGIQG